MATGQVWSPDSCRNPWVYGGVFTSSCVATAPQLDYSTLTFPRTGQRPSARLLAKPTKLKPALDKVISFRTHPPFSFPRPELDWGQPCLMNAVSVKVSCAQNALACSPAHGTQGTPGHRKHPLLLAPPVLELVPCHSQFDPPTRACRAMVHSCDVLSICLTCSPVGALALP